MSAEFQLKYMVQELGTVLGLEDATPAELVQAVRELMSYAEELKSRDVERSLTIDM